MTRKSSLWLILLLVVPIAFGLARLRFNVDVLDLLPADIPVVHGLKVYQQSFSNARELIIALRAPDADAAENAARTFSETLRQNKSVVREVTWQPPWLERPSQAAELIAYLW